MLVFFNSRSLFQYLHYNESDTDQKYQNNLFTLIDYTFS